MQFEAAALRRQGRALCCMPAAWAAAGLSARLPGRLPLPAARIYRLGFWAR